MLVGDLNFVLAPEFNMASKSLTFEQFLRMTVEELKIEADAREIDTKAMQKPDLQIALARNLQTALAPPAAVQISNASQTELLLVQAELEELKIAAAAEERKAAAEERKLAAAADQRRFAAKERKLAAEAEQHKRAAELKLNVSVLPNSKLKSVSMLIK